MGSAILASQLNLIEAFGRVDNTTLFNAFKLHGISYGLISGIKRLYTNLIGRADDIKRFPIYRGVKQRHILPILSMRSWKL